MLGRPSQPSTPGGAPMHFFRRGTIIVLSTALLTLALPGRAGLADDLYSGPGSNPQVEADFAALESAVDKLEAGPAAGFQALLAAADLDALLAIVPQAVYDEFPEYGNLVRGTTPVPTFVQSGATIPPCPAQGTQLL